jgi:FtsZ-interacting cell division protein ZipA
MSEEPKLYHHGHVDEEYEREDMTPGTIFAFLVGLAIACALVYFIIIGMYKVLDSYARSHQPAENPLVVPTSPDSRDITLADVNKFPQPRLETNERIELNGFRLAEEQELHSYGWVDKDAGTVHIPIEQAMQILAQRGLPTTPRVGTAPASTVQMTEQAAAKADTSQKTPAKPPQTTLQRKK